MIIIEEQHNQESERKRCKYPLGIQFPEMDEPVSWLCGVEGSADRYTSNICRSKRSRDMGESDPEDCTDL